MWEYVAFGISICIFGIAMIYSGWRYREHVEWKKRKVELDTSDSSRPSREQVRAGAIRDQIWSHLRDEYSDLERIICEGPSKDDDVAIVRSALMALLGEIDYRAAILEKVDI